MKAIVLTRAGGTLELRDIPKPVPTEGEVLIRLSAASVNHRDIWIRQGQYGQIEYPCVPGSDGAGIIEVTGQGADSSLVGKQVIINPSLYWGEQRAGQAKDFQILGVPSQGTFAEYVCVPSSNVYPIPDGYDFEKAAALPLAGLTAHRALFYRGDLKTGQKILITGIGGGVSSFLLGFAVRTGAVVYTTSSSSEKLNKARELGARHGVNYTVDGWDKELLGLEPEGFDLVVDSAGGPAFISLIKLLKAGGKIVVFGRTAGNIPEISPAILFYKQVSILGTTMGAPADFEGMLEFVCEHNMRPVIDKVYPLEEAEKAFQYIENTAQFGKVILKIG